MPRVKYIVVFVALFATSRFEAGAQPAPPRHLALSEAQDIALKLYPRISIAHLTALAARENAIQVRSALFPNIYGSATGSGVGDENNTRLAAGQLSNPRIFDREAEGISISQLITDFGRTSELTRSAKFRTRADEMNLAATREQVLLEVNNAYFSTLEAQAVMDVARQTVSARHSILQQTQMLATNKLKSDLDVSFASVDLDQASILLARATNALLTSYAVLSDLLAERRPVTYALADEPMAPRITNGVAELILEALAQRPELASLRYQSDAAREFARAEGKLIYPSINAMGQAGVVPEGPTTQFTSPYAVGAVNINVPIYAGGLYTSRRHEAEYQARAAEESLRDEEDNIIRDVQMSQLNFDLAFEQLALSRELLKNANDALALTQARFKNGLSSVVDLSQAELNQTQAQIGDANARYDYQIKHSALNFQLGRLAPGKF
jgi:outer membrane protein